MTKNETGQNSSTQTDTQPYRVRLPGFISDNEVGLGDVIKRATSAIGVRPCGGCEHRAGVQHSRTVHGETTQFNPVIAW